MGRGEGGEEEIFSKRRIKFYGIHFLKDNPSSLSFFI
jgi:hypothetical protein